jgi:hypothetical protein
LGNWDLADYFSIARHPLGMVSALSIYLVHEIVPRARVDAAKHERNGVPKREVSSLRAESPGFETGID